MSTVRGAGRIRGLDGLRGIGAFMVVLYHLSDNHLFPAWPVVKSGSLFVLVFFVLSGLVISFSAERSGSFVPRAFLWRRFARVWPLHASILVAMLAFHSILWLRSGVSINAYFQGDHSLPSFVASLLLVQTMGIYDHVVWNGPSWSISIEFYTYFAYALLFWLMRSRAWVGYGAMVVVSIMVFAFHGGWGTLPYAWRFFYATFGFFSGALIFRYVADREPKPGVPVLTALRQVLFVALFVWGLSLYAVHSQAIYLLYPLIIFIIVDLGLDRGFLPSLLSIRPLRFLGEISYAIYLTHIPLLNVFARLFGAAVGQASEPGDLASIWFLVVYFPVLFVLSWGLFRWVEVPARKMLTQSRSTSRFVAR